MGASESTQQQQQHQGEEVPSESVRYAVHSEEERGFYGQPVSSLEATSPPPTSTYGLFINALTAFIPEEHVGRLVVYMAVFGALFSVIGVLGLVFPFVFALAVEQIMGSLMVLGGVFAVLQYLIMYDMPGNSSFLLLGFLHLGFGLWMLFQPIEAGIMLMFVLSGWLLGHGLLKSLMACQVRNLNSWPFVFVSGILSVVLAFVILVLTPRYGVVLLGIIFGVDVFVSGLSMILIAATTYFSRKPLGNTVREPFLQPD